MKKRGVDKTAEVLSEKLKITYQLSPSQKAAMRSFAANDIVFILGEAGTGKSFAAMVAAYSNVIAHGGRICLTRPVVEASGRGLGFLPGPLQEKFAPYLAPLDEIVPEIASNPKLARNSLDECPLGYMRGRTFKGVLVLDEAQNCSWSELVLATTRIGKGGKMIVTGDLEQSDVAGRALDRFLAMLRGVEGVGIVKLRPEDQQRSGIVSRIQARIREWEDDDDDDGYKDRVD